MKKVSSLRNKTLYQLRNYLIEYGLEVVGHFKSDNNDKALLGVSTVILIGPSEPLFWKIFCKSIEYLDGKENPLDRWSKRVITKISKKIDGKAFFPFGEHVWPFYSWAIKCVDINSSPVKLLVHNKKGLFISFRGALGIPDIIENEEIENFCVNCHKPCLTACPVNALNENGYDVVKCKSHITSHSGQECQSGCVVRKSCPIGSDLRLPEQSNFHMKSFLKDLV